MPRLPFEFAFVGPERAANSEIMESGANDHDIISKLLTKVSAFIFDNSTTFNATDGVFNGDPQSGDVLVKPLLKFR